MLLCNYTDLYAASFLDPGVFAVPCVPTRSDTDSQHELARRMSSIAHSMANSVNYTHRHLVGTNTCSVCPVLCTVDIWQISHNSTLYTVLD